MGGVEMKFCPNCNVEYEDKFAFCHHCGRKLQEKIEQNFCPYCGNKVETDGEFCPFCGNSLKETEAVSTINNYEVSTNSTLTTSNKSSLPKFNIEIADIKPNQAACKIKDSEEPFFSKEHLLTYGGRRGRMSFISVQVFWSVITSVVTFCLTPVVLAMGDIGLLLAFIIDAIMAYPLFCNVAKRMHDLDWPTSRAVALAVAGIILSWLIEATKPFSRSNDALLYGRVIVAVAFCIPFLLLNFKKGTDGPNQYGSDPL